MIEIVRYSGDKKDEWNAFNASSKMPLFMFDKNYMDYHSDRFTDHSLFFYDEGEMIAIMPCSEHGRELRSHGGLTFGGLIFDEKSKQYKAIECIEALITYLKDNGIERLLYKPIPHIYHEQPSEEDLYALFQSGGRPIEISASTVINLSCPLKMPKGRKAQISRAKREGVDVKRLEEKKYYESFIQLENEVLISRHNVRAIHSADELYMLHERFPDNIHLYGAIYNDELIAGTVLFEYGQIIHTQYMAANEKAREIGALDLTISIVMGIYMSSKKWLDFGISTEDGGRYLNKGLIAQKEGFGGRTNVYQLWEITI